MNEYFRDQHRLMRDSSGSEFLISNFPDLWPLNTFKLACEYLPDQLNDALRDTKFGYVDDSSKMLALALSDLNKVYLVNGLPIKILEALYATIPDKRAYLNQQNFYPEEIFQYASNIKSSITKIIIAKTNGESIDEIEDHYDSFYDWREKLSNDYPDYRQVIESFAAGPANSVMIFIFLHELGHVFLRHGAYTNDRQHNHRIEYEADGYALDILLDSIDDHEALGTLGHLAFAPLFFSIMEFYDRLNGVDFKGSLHQLSHTHPRKIDRRAEILRKIGHFVQNDNVLKERLKKEINFSYSVHILLSDFVSKLKLDPLLPFFTKSDVSLWDFPNPPFHAFNDATESVKGVEYLPYQI